MEYRYLKLTELEQELGEIYEADSVEYAVAQPIERPNAVPDAPVELTNTENPTVGADPTVKLQGSSTADNQCLENTQPVGVDCAQPESELIDEEEESSVHTVDAVEAVEALEVVEHQEKKIPCALRPPWVPWHA
jgi:hypothetical protein